MGAPHMFWVHPAKKNPVVLLEQNTRGPLDALDLLIQKYESSAKDMVVEPLKVEVVLCASRSEAH